MPKQVDEMVEALLSDPKFYPEKSEKQHWNDLKNMQWYKIFLSQKYFASHKIPLKNSRLLLKPKVESKNFWKSFFFNTNSLKSSAHIRNFNFN